MKLKYRLAQIALLVGVLLAWLAAGSLHLANPLLLPTLPNVVVATIALVAGGSLWADLFLTLIEVAAGFLIAAGAGLITGYLVGRSASATELVDPILTSLYAVPVILVFPVYILLFGLEAKSKIAIGATVGFFPIAINTMAGFARVTPIFVAAARSMGANAWQLFRLVLFPAAYQSTVIGLRLGFTLTFVTVLGAEAIGARGGLGHQIALNADAMETATMYAYMLVVIALAAMLNLVAGLAESRALARTAAA